MVCADSSYFEPARMLALKGAAIICTVFNSSRYAYEVLVPGSVHRTVARAVENRVFAEGCNRVGDEDANHFPGGTCLVAPTGEVLAEARAETEASPSMLSSFQQFQRFLAEQESRLLEARRSGAKAPDGPSRPARDRQSAAQPDAQA